MMPPLKMAIRIFDGAGIISRDFHRWLQRLSQNNGIDNDMLRDSAPLSVIGNPTDATADPQDIAGTAGQVLRVSDDGTTLGFGDINARSVSGLQNLVDGDILDLLAHAFDRIAFLEKALRISYKQKDLGTPEAFALLEDRIKWM